MRCPIVLHRGYAQNSDEVRRTLFLARCRDVKPGTIFAVKFTIQHFQSKLKALLCDTMHAFTSDGFRAADQVGVTGAQNKDCLNLYACLSYAVCADYNAKHINVYVASSLHVYCICEVAACSVLTW